MKKKKLIAQSLVLAMAVSTLAGFAPATVSAAPAKPKLSATSKTLEEGASFTLKVKKAKGVKSISKTTWKTSKKKVAVLKKSKKTSTKVVAKKTGSAKITATVKYKLSNGKSASKMLTCKVKVVKKAAPTAAPTNAPATNAPAAPTNAPATNAPAAPTAEPTVAPTFEPYVVSNTDAFYNKAGYYATYNGAKSFKGTDNLYINYVMADSKEVNTKASIVNKLEFAIDSRATVEYGIYVSNWDCAGKSAKDPVAKFSTNGTEGQVVSLDLAGASIDAIANEKISFGIYSTDSANKNSQVYRIYDFKVGYDDVLYPVPLTTNTVGCTSSTKDIWSTRDKDASVATADGYTALSELTAAKGYKFGTVVTYDQIQNDPEFCKLVAKHCDSITAANEFKAYSLLDKTASAAATDGMPVMNFTQADTICEFAKENGLKIRGHALVWDQSMCQWFFNEGYADNETDADGKVTNRVSSEIMKARLKSYIEQVITHFEEKYPGVIYCWDVVNEGIDAEWDGKTPNTDDPLKIRQKRDGEANPFYYVLGSDYIQYSFLCARDTLDALNNTTIDLVYNDFNVIYGGKREAIIALAKEINKYAKDAEGKNRKLCDSIGMQGYLGYGNQGNCLGDDLVSGVTSAIKDMANAGFKVQLTEMAMRNFTNTDKYMADHAAFAKKLFQGLADINTQTKNAFTSMSIWAFINDPTLNYTDDEYEYDIYTPYSGLFDEVYTPLDSFKEIYQAFGGELPE